MPADSDADKKRTDNQADPEPPAEPELPAAPVEEDPFDAAVAVAEDGPDDTSSDEDGRSPEDLLSEFEHKYFIGSKFYESIVN